MTRNRKVMNGENPHLKICYDRVVPPEHGPVGPVIHKMREDALLHATGAKSPRHAFHHLDAGGVIPPPHLALITGKQ
jgi:hypothetical protein